MRTDIIELTSAPANSVELSKTNAENIATQVINQVQEGFIDPLDTLAKLSFLSQTIEQALKAIRPIALNEAEKYGEKNFDAFGVNFQIKETAVKYDYSQNEEWQQFDEQEKELKLLKKQLEDRLKFSKQAIKSSTTTVQVTLKK